MSDTPEERESAVFSAIAQRTRAEKALRERDEARTAAVEALEIARQATEVADAAVTRAERRQATIKRIEALVADGVVNPHPPNVVWVRADELLAVLKAVKG